MAASTPTLVPLATAPDATDRALLRTLAYADLHSYPLFTHEIAELAAAEPGAPLTEPLSEASAELRLASLARAGRVHRDGAAWALRAEVARNGAAVRADALGKTRRLLARHGALVRVFRALPFVRFIGLSGDAAFGWSRAADADVDLFILAAPGRLFTATLAVKLLLRLTGKTGAVCPNYLADASGCQTASHELFTAMQVASVWPWHDEAGTYAAFRWQNRWIREWLPQVAHLREPWPAPVPSRTAMAVRRAVEWLLGGRVGEVIERAARFLCQRLFARGLRAAPDSADGYVSDVAAKLHTRSNRVRTILRLRERLASLGLPGDVDPLPPMGHDRA